MRGRGRPLDLSTVRDAMSDDREWISNATVADEDPIEFDAELGPLVNAVLQPSKTPCRCRVGMRSAGRGEAEFEPFVAGDEVLVALPQGSARAGGVIIARLCNSIDTFPTGSVAGQDPASNAFSFRRSRAGYIHEIGGAYLLRQATSEAFLSIDEQGTITLRDGAAAALQMSPDVFGYQSGDARFLMQLDISGERFTLQCGDAILTLSSSRASPETNAFVVPGQLAMATNANPAIEHVVTTEALANILVAFGAAIAPTPVTPLQVAAAFSAAALATLNPLVAAAVALVFSEATQKPPGVPGQGQSKPGIGCAGLLAG